MYNTKSPQSLFCGGFISEICKQVCTFALLKCFNQHVVFYIPVVYTYLRILKVVQKGAEIVLDIEHLSGEYVK